MIFLFFFVSKINHFRKLTCLRFKRFNAKSGDDGKRLEFKRTPGPCRSEIGTEPGEQVHAVEIGDQCYNHVCALRNVSSIKFEPSK